ncbi:MAG: superoxide dismutase family protein [Gammaproteobacteria bacterium]
MCGSDGRGWPYQRERKRHPKPGERPSNGGDHRGHGSGHLGRRSAHRTPLGGRDQGGRRQLFVECLPEGRHAVRVHEVASCQPAAAGGHFDPGPFGNSSPDGNHPFHLGDLINVVVTPEGRGRIRTKTTRFTLSPGPLSLFDSDGSVFIIHANPDTFCPDGEVPGCAGGPRVACGIIKQPSTDASVSPKRNRRLQRNRR